jgi:hypothetical protein
MMFRSLLPNFTSRILLGGIAIAGLLQPAFGQEPHDKIRPSLVYLEASGDIESGPEIGMTARSIGTGFIISSDGLVLTTAHLLTALQKNGNRVVANTVLIKAHVGGHTGEEMIAQIVDDSEQLDLLLLKLPPRPPTGFPEVTLARAQDHIDSQPIYSSGFTQDNIRSRPSTIQSKHGPGGYLWTTGFTFEPGESGSPIYDAAGRVIGVVKGDQGSFAYMIPIEYGDSLLAQIRLRDVQKLLQDFQGLRQRFNWSGELTAVPDGHLFTLKYEKMVPGEPHVQKVSLKIRPIGQKGDIEPFPEDELEQSAAIGATGGAFPLPALWGKIDGLNAVYKVGKIRELRITIAATLTNGEKLPKTTIDVPYEEDSQ